VIVGLNYQALPFCGRLSGINFPLFSRVRLTVQRSVQF
jgi:hypothetical protein